MRSLRHILLVEDNPGDAMLVREAFRDAKISHRLHVAEDGVVALQFLRRQDRFRAVPSPDLILLDLNLPRKDGREVLAEIKQDEELKKIPVIILTTSEDEADIEKAYSLHANSYLTKPVDMDDFIRSIHLIEEFWLKLACLPRHGRSTPLG
jgi:two-component system, chemotaxis family, response regulator Rcp1